MNSLQFYRGLIKNMCLLQGIPDLATHGNPITLSDCRKIPHPWTQWDVEEKGTRKQEYMKEKQITSNCCHDPVLCPSDTTHFGISS